jgi:hypothetical protein
MPRMKSPPRVSAALAPWLGRPSNLAMTSVTPVCTLADLILYACSFAH